MIHCSALPGSQKIGRSALQPGNTEARRFWPCCHRRPRPSGAGHPLTPKPRFFQTYISTAASSTVPLQLLPRLKSGRTGTLPITGCELSFWTRWCGRWDLNPHDLSATDS